MKHNQIPFRERCLKPREILAAVGKIMITGWQMEGAARAGIQYVPGEDVVAPEDFEAIRSYACDPAHAILLREDGTQASEA